MAIIICTLCWALIFIEWYTNVEMLKWWLLIPSIMKLYMNLHMRIRQKRKLSMHKTNYPKKLKIARHFEGLRLSKILNSNTTPNKFSIHQLKITFKHWNFVRKPFFVCWKRHTPPWFYEFKFLIFSRLFYIISAQAMYINKKLCISSRFAKLKAISNLFSFLFKVFHCIHKPDILIEISSNSTILNKFTRWLVHSLVSSL